MRMIAVLACCWACLGVSGCAARQQPQAAAPASAGGGTTLPNSAFLAILRSVPPSQRQAYTQQHPDQVARILQSPNRLDRAEYGMMMRAK